MRRRICAVFDIDDTLYLERDYVRSGFQAVGRWVSRWLGIDGFAELCWNEFIGGKRHAIFDEALRKAGRKAQPELISTLVELYRTHTPTIELAPDAAGALIEISEIATIAVISDGPLASQSRKVEALGLSSFAEPILLTATLGSEFRKPHRRAFELMRQENPATLYAYIADNPLKDFAAPKEMGWLTVRVRRPGGLHYSVDPTDAIPDREIDDCSTLFDIFERL